MDINRFFSIKLRHSTSIRFYFQPFHRFVRFSSVARFPPLPPPMGMMIRLKWISIVFFTADSKISSYRRYRSSGSGFHSIFQPSTKFLRSRIVFRSFFNHQVDGDPFWRAILSGFSFGFVVFFAFFLNKK